MATERVSRLTQKTLRGGAQEASLELPERIVQVGEGRFLRGFADWIIQQMNDAGSFQGRAVVLAPRPSGAGTIELLNGQDGLFTVALRGLDDGQLIDRREVVTTISRALDTVAQWSAVLALAEDAAIQLLISNTTEAGLVYAADPYQPGVCPTTFPAKVTAYLYHRYQHFKGSEEAGMTMLPTELVERNGDLLRTLVERYSQEWKLPMPFVGWVKRSNSFCNTLVDRIVTGFPKNVDPEVLAAELGYQDALYTEAEPFYLWAIEADARLRSLWPEHRLPRGVRLVEDITPFQRTKVGILNGAHTALYPLARLSGVHTVAEAMDHHQLGPFIEALVREEIVLALAEEGVDGRHPLSHGVLLDYAQETFERFRNPFLHHQIHDLGLNNQAKIRARLLPSLRQYVARFGTLPKRLGRVMAAHWMLEQVMTVVGEENDPAQGLVQIRKTWRGLRSDDRLLSSVQAWLGRPAVWGEDLSALPGLAEWMLEAVQAVAAADTAALYSIINPDVTGL